MNIFSPYIKCLVFTLTTTMSLFLSGATQAQSLSAAKLIIGGFSPDPSICRVDSDYYLCNSSFTWYPGLPIYHSTDLEHWKLVSHAIDRPGMITLDDVKDKDGVWAPTIRYHDGLFYLFCNVSNGGSFFITAKDVKGPWSRPVYIKDEKGVKAMGIDPDIFWDEDGQAYYLSNSGKFPGRKYKGSTAIYLQKIDLSTGTLLGNRQYIATGHAFNAKYAEGPHLYKIGEKYVLLVAEGGTDFYHASTILTSKNITGPYLAQQNNPVLTNRNLGHNAAIQCVGHADLVDTPDGNWFAVCLGKRMLFAPEQKNVGYAFSRETFLVPVTIEGGEFFFNPGFGCIPSVPVEQQADGNQKPRTIWYYNRIPHEKFETWNGNTVIMRLLPECIDSLVSPAMILTKVSPMGFDAAVRLTFNTKKANEEAGLVLHRNNQAYIAVLKGKGMLRVFVCDKGLKKEIAAIPYATNDVVLRMTVRGLDASIQYGTGDDDMKVAAHVSITPLADDGKLNRFNGVGFGMYASSNGKDSKAKARFSNIDLSTGLGCH